LAAMTSGGRLTLGGGLALMVMLLLLGFAFRG
jgi:hypothetical protein